MEVQHRAMEEGLMVVHVKVYNENTSNQVMHAEALLEQAQTAYIFTGQGTQEKGMGMALYATNKAAQSIWDRAERHFKSQYGRI
jgi:fatty acid synthase subunit beta